jgi:hypothetical protein
MRRRSGREDGEVPPGDKIELRGPIGGYFVWEPSDGGPLMPISSELRFGVNSGAAPTRTVRPEGACRSPHSRRPASATALSLS